MKRILIAILILPLLTHAFDINAAQPRIQITPDEAFIGDPAGILLRGFPKNTPVTVDVRETNTYGDVFESHAQFLTDQHGRVDVTKQAPLSGTYQHRDPSGLFWSMSMPEIVFTRTPRRELLQPVAFQFTASVNGQMLAHAEFRRLLLAPGVQRIPVRAGKLRGALFVPPRKSPHPAVIVLGGSEGGLGSAEPTASYLASKGYAALALAYFRYDDLPKYLENIPLEYFGDAIHWLQSQPEIRPDKIAVLGGSRGGELALLLGSTFPQIKAVVAISPSCVVWQGLGTNDHDPAPAWTCQGSPVPFMNVKMTPEQSREIQKAIQEHLDVNLLGFRMELSDTNAVEKASIPVEKINGPVLLVSGNDDQLWPSTEMSDMVMVRLKQMKHPYPDCHLAYAGVGHYIPLPTLPATIHSFGREQLGGNTEQTAAAALDSWTRIVKFLNDNLKE